MQQMSKRKGNILVTCGGKWVGIVVQLREAMQRHSGFASCKIIVASSDELTPAGCFADETFQVPLIRHPDYVDRLFEICQKRGVGVIIPLIDLDLERLTGELSRFNEIGTTVICPKPALTELCFDKYRFAQFAEQNGLEHPRTHLIDQAQALRFPAFHKRRRGFGSIGGGVSSSLEEAQLAAERDPELIFQEKIDAVEITVDAYISAEGKGIIRVPRIRDKVVAGEAYKSHTISDRLVEDLADRTINALANAGLRGPLNVQIFKTSPPMLLEVNTRLGSACVLSNMAVGGRLLDAILIEAAGGIAEGDPNDYIVGMRLDRFLGDVFHKEGQVIGVRP